MKKYNKLIIVAIWVLLSLLLPFTLVKGAPINDYDDKNINYRELKKSAGELHISGNFETFWDPSGVAISTADAEQARAEICRDSEGGWIIAWEDYRNGNHDIYAQKINSNGIVQWATNGVPICTANGDQENVQICSDNNGGAIIIWDDWRDGYPEIDIYAQRVDSSGAVLWANNGLVINNASGEQSWTRVCSDNSGNFIITWDDIPGIYAQKINLNGELLWDINGELICNTNLWEAEMISDGAGGAIITWCDHRNGNEDIYAQRVNSNGIDQWTPNGVAICTAIDDQWIPNICSDGTGGAIITWEDERDGTSDIYTQRIDSDGNILWTPNGTAICTVSNFRLDTGPNTRLCSDEIGGAIITWRDERSGQWDIYAQRIDSDGIIQWNNDGLVICYSNMEHHEMTPILLELCSDGAGGAFFTWADQRGETPFVYAQQVNSDGNALWTTNGELLCGEGTSAPMDICNDGTGGAVIIWGDLRSGNLDLYAQYVKNVPSNGNGDKAIPFELIIIISTVSGAAVIGVSIFVLLRRRQRKSS